MASLGAVLAGCHQLHACVGRMVVVKYGGAAVGRSERQAAFADDIVRLQRAGVRPVVVHGGGDLVEMVLAGKINAEIVSLLNHHGGRAIGLSGKDADLIVAHREAPLRVLEDHDLIPVVAAIATGCDGETYNVNADHAAAALAVALHAVMLLQVTDVPGIRDAAGRLVRHLDRAGVERLVDAGVIDGGMRPKTDAALRALTGGVERVKIIDGNHPHVVALAVMDRLPACTEITP